MDGSGCKNCPAYQKCTAQYRSSRCAHNRATYGVESDPFTNADRIRAMSDEELADVVVCPHTGNWDLCRDDCKKCRLEWLKQPAEVTDIGQA